jgi:sulfur carrier protein ThiS
MKIRYRDEEWEIEGPLTVRQAIQEVGLSSKSLLTVRDGKVITDDTMLDEDDEIKLLAVISGG